MVEHLPEAICKICGYINEQPFQIGDLCPCCVAEIQFDEETLEKARKYRKAWLEKGAFCRAKNQLHVDGNWQENWSAEEQMKNIPPEWQ